MALSLFFFSFDKEREELVLFILEVKEEGLIIDEVKEGVEPEDGMGKVAGLISIISVVRGTDLS